MKRISTTATVCLLLATAGCKDDKENSEESGLEDYEGRGTEACQEWQYSLCEFMAEKCGLSSEDRSLCEEQYGSFECLSDETALECVDAFQTAETCDEALYSQCDWESIADPQPAIDGCDALNETQCERWIGCDSTSTMETCLAEMTETLDCSTAVGLSASYEECMDAIETWACTDTAPSVCTGVILAM